MLLLGVTRCGWRGPERSLAPLRIQMRLTAFLPHDRYVRNARCVIYTFHNPPHAIREFLHICTRGNIGYVPVGVYVHMPANFPETRLISHSAIYHSLTDIKYTYIYIYIYMHSVYRTLTSRKKKKKNNIHFFEYSLTKGLTGSTGLWLCENLSSFIRGG